jgi:hypothetical protein
MASNGIVFIKVLRKPVSQFTDLVSVPVTESVRRRADRRMNVAKEFSNNEKYDGEVRPYIGLRVDIM